MQLEVGKIPPVLIPVNGRPILESVVERYADAPGECSFVLVVNQGKELVKAHVLARHAAGNVRVVEVASEEDLGATLVSALRQTNLEAYDALILHFGDTLIEADIPYGRDAIFYQDLKESFRWTTFQTEGGKISRIVDKYVSESIDWNHVFTGLFAFERPQALLGHLEQCSAHSDIGLFYSALQAYVADRDVALVKVKEWYDFGHSDNYYQAKKRFINKRFFNVLEIDEHRAILKKKSANVDRFIGEIRWYLELPSSLRCYIPQVFDYSLERNSAFIKMEYYGYTTIADLYMSSGYNLGIWNHVFDALFRLIQEMRTYQLHVSQAEINVALKDMYVRKTLERLEAISKHDAFSALFRDDIAINARDYKPLGWYVDRLPRICETILSGSLSCLSIVHGDLCISNVLFDPKSRILKMVDPRGKFGENTIYGDYRYELAKLSHSFNGSYELIVGDMATVSWKPGQIAYSVRLSDYQRTVSDMFNRRLHKLFPEQARSVALIEALLFLSMVPLHADSVSRQMVMLATGIEKLDRFVKESGIA